MGREIVCILANRELLPLRWDYNFASVCLSQRLLKKVIDEFL